MGAQSTQNSKTWIITTTLGLVIGFISGCSRPNPTPELIDPIYADLVQRSAVAKAGAETKKAEIKKIKADLAELPARDPTKRKLQEDLSKNEMLLVVADQEGLYYEIRAQQRKAYARDEYIRAFDAGKTWPDPKDFEIYKIQRKLRDSPREWTGKTEKTGRYNRKTAEEQRKSLDDKLKAEPGGGGAKH
ncbi:hypothetical protein BH10BDE1_BH10BDE1_22190 [soil metagenome]